MPMLSGKFDSSIFKENWFTHNETSTAATISSIYLCTAICSKKFFDFLDETVCAKQYA